jgi:hypothetical protein
MMTKKLLMGLGVFSLLAIPAINASALGVCTNVEVTEAGAAYTGKVVKLKNMSGANCGTAGTLWANGVELYFFLDTPTSTQASAMLAAALSAQATGNKVTVILKSGDDFTQWKQLGALYAKNTP